MELGKTKVKKRKGFGILNSHHKPGDSHPSNQGRCRRTIKERDSNRVGNRNRDWLGSRIRDRTRDWLGNGNRNGERDRNGDLHYRGKKMSRCRRKRSGRQRTRLVDIRTKPDAKSAGRESDIPTSFVRSVWTALVQTCADALDVSSLKGNHAVLVEAALGWE